MSVFSVFIDLEHSWQLKPVSELSEIFSETSDVLEAAAAMSDPLKARTHVIHELERLRERTNIPASNGRKSDGTGFICQVVKWVVVSPLLFLLLFLSGMLQTLPLPTAKCYMFHWEKDNFGKLFPLITYCIH